MNVRFKLMREGARLPRRATSTSGAFDIFAPEAGTIKAGESKLIPTGLGHEVPDYMDVQLLGRGSRNPNDATPAAISFQLHGLLISRSGLASHHHVKLYFDPCLIDHDYRGEIKLLLHNTGNKDYSWTVGERLCQIAYVPFFMGGVELATQLSQTDRGAGGFGSTGK